MRERDIAVARAVQQCLNGIRSAPEISWKPGYTGKKGHLSGTSTLRSMERRNLVGRIPPRDRWSNAKWFLTTEAKEQLAALENAAP